MVAEVLGKIHDDGGVVSYKKQDNTDSVDILLVQTKKHRAELRKFKP